MTKTLPTQTRSLLSISIQITFMVAALQYSPELLKSFVRYPVEFTQETPVKWSASTQSLDAGTYYISVGRPQGLCSITLGSEELSSNFDSRTQTKTDLLLGSSFRLENVPSKERLIITCLSLEGFEPRLHHSPVVTHHRVGPVLQMVRGFTDIIIGPLFSILLIFTALTGAPAIRISLRRVFPLVLFGLTALAYSLSLAQVGSLFLSGIDYTTAHISVRAVFSAAFLYLMGAYSVSRTSLVLANLSVLFVCVLVSSANPEQLVSTYKLVFVTFPISTMLSTATALKRPITASARTLLVPIGATWTAVQCFDYANLLFFSAPFLGPSFIAVVTFMLSTFSRNETAKIQAQAEIDAAQLKITQAAVKISTHLSHDIRAPLGLLKVLSKDERLPEDLRSTLSLASTRIQGVANDLLEWGRANATRGDVNLHSLRNLLRLIVTEKNKVYEGKATVLLECDPKEADPMAYLEPNEFFRTLSNLIDNSIEATKNEEPVRVVLRLTENHALIEVIDRGTGIDAAIIGKLFQEGASFGKPAGNGLGLSYAKQAIVRWGGDIKLHSDPDQGTTVQIQLPRPT